MAKSEAEHIEHLKDLIKRQKEIGAEMRDVVFALEALSKQNRGEAPVQEPRQERPTSSSSNQP